jgi:peptide deformylase
MKLVDITHPALIAKAKRVETIDATVRKTIAKMKRALQRSDIGIGLAAPQIGVSLQIFMVSPNMPEVKDKKSEPIQVFINPKITKKSKLVYSKSKKTLEGCLSIPDVWGPVARSKQVTLSYTDESGNTQTSTFEGYIATIVQHEVDHLQGILFTRRAIEQGEQIYRSVDDDMVPIDL